jgi:hypothetical protein
VARRFRRDGDVRLCLLSLLYFPAGRMPQPNIGSALFTAIPSLFYSCSVCTIPPLLYCKSSRSEPSPLHHWNVCATGGPLPLLPLDCWIHRSSQDHGRDYLSDEATFVAFEVSTAFWAAHHTAAFTGNCAAGRWHAQGVAAAVVGGHGAWYSSSRERSHCPRLTTHSVVKVLGTWQYFFIGLLFRTLFLPIRAAGTARLWTAPVGW